MNFRPDTIANQFGQATESAVIRPLQTEAGPRPLWNAVDSLLSLSDCRTAAGPLNRIRLAGSGKSGNSRVTRAPWNSLSWSIGDLGRRKAPLLCGQSDYGSIKTLKLGAPDNLAFDTFGLRILSVLSPRTADR